MQTSLKYLLVIVVIASLYGCSSAPLVGNDNLCDIFKQRPKWYQDALKSAARWGGPVYLPMAIMYQESGFKRKAKPPMRYFLGFIPKGRASNAYGYSQALKGTWAQYQQEIGSSFKNRDNFANSYDFIQWYMQKTRQQNGISKWDAYAQYLNYHEGQGGYSRGSHLKKPWLLKVATKVDRRAKRYSAQLLICQSELAKRKRWF